MRFGPSRTVADRLRGALIGTTLLHPGARRAHQPNGNLLVMPDVVDFVLATAGTAQVQIALPASPALVGQVLYHQMIPFEIDPCSASSRSPRRTRRN